VSRRTYGVKIVRGPVVKLPPHELACDGIDDLLGLAGSIRQPLAADLFCGAGGLSFGLEAAGFRVVFGVDHDPVALETHRHHFAGLTLDRDLSESRAIEEIAETIRLAGVRVVAGGPPCQPFSRAGRSKIRSLVGAGMRPARDERRDLWQSFLEIVELATPDAVVIENVPDMALGDDMLVLRTMAEWLSELGYGVHPRLIDAWRFGVPQHRQRFFLVAIADDGDFEWPQPEHHTVTVRDAIGDLPRVVGGYRPPGGGDGYQHYARPAFTAFQRRARAGRPATDRGRVHDHITRPVREDDRRAFEQMTSSTRYSQLAPELRRYRDDIFDDKYKRLPARGLSRTITAHIARDGYWYIHPTQHRTLTVREAARLQTFSDGVRFSGPPSAAFHQIGNAVPPRLAEIIACQVKIALKRRRTVSPLPRLITEELVDWWRAEGATARPWLESGRAWLVLLGEVFLARATAADIAAVWPQLSQMDSPRRCVSRTDQLQSLAESISRRDRVAPVLRLARWVSARPGALADGDVLRHAPGVGADIAALAALVSGTENPVVVSGPALRVAARYFDVDVDRVHCRSDGRLAVARLIGGADDANEAHLGLIELGSRMCSSRRPQCSECPLRPWCRWARRSRGRQLQRT
jgi:DNA (cytosine-5)-methyltransferase 1